MSDTAIFYTLSTIAQAIATAVSIAAVFVVYWNQVMQNIVNAHSGVIINAFAVDEGFGLAAGIQGGSVSLKEFFGKLKSLLASTEISQAKHIGIIQAAMYLAVYGRHQRFIHRMFRLSLAVSIPTVAFSIALLPAGEWTAARWYIAYLPLAGAITTLTILGRMFWTIAGPTIDADAEAAAFRD